MPFSTDVTGIVPTQENDMLSSRIGLLMAALTMRNTIEPVLEARNRNPYPVNTGRQAEKDAAALAKAEAKRARKAAKRIKDAS